MGYNFFQIEAKERRLTINSGLLLLSILDFGNPISLSLAIAIERPEGGVVKLGTSFVFGEPVEEHSPAEDVHHRRNRRSNPLRRATPPEDTA